MFLFSSQKRGLASPTRRNRRGSPQRAQQARRLALESLERRDLFAVVPMAPITFGGELTDAGYAVAFDEGNNCYLTGIFSDTVDFDPGPGVANLTSNGDVDIFVAKYSADGSLAWARGFGGSGQDGSLDWRQSISVDAGGNVYVLNTFRGTVAFDDIVLTSIGPQGEQNWIANVVMCLNTTGNVEWAQGFGNATYVGGIALHTPTGVSAASSVYVAGSFYLRPQQFGSQQLTPTSGSRDGFFSRLDATTGEFTWTKKSSGRGDELFTNVTIDSATGSVYLTGYKIDEAIIGPFTSGKKSGKAAIVAKTDLAGNYQWAKAIATGSSDAWGISTHNGSVFVAGWFDSQYAQFDNIRLTNANGRNGGNDIFVTALNGNGSVSWATRIGSTASDSAGWRRPTIAADGIGSVFLANALGGQATLGGDTLPAGHFVSQINTANGQFVKSWSLGAGIQFRNIGTDAEGDLWVTGLFQGNVTFPDGTTASSNNGSQDIFLQQFSHAAPAAPPPPGGSGSTSALDAASVQQLLVEAESTWTTKSRRRLASVSP